MTLTYRVQLLIGVAALLVSAVGLRHFAKSAPQHVIEAPTNPELPPLARFEPKLLSLIFLGEPRLYQSFLARWVESLFAGALPEINSANQLFSTYDIIAKHEPKSEWFYIGPCLVFSERLQRPDLCFSIIGYGQRALPASWRIPVAQAYVELYRLRNIDRARFYLEIAAKKPRAPSEIESSLQPDVHLPEQFDFQMFKRLIGDNGLRRYGLQMSNDG